MPHRRDCVSDLRRTVAHFDDAGQPIDADFETSVAAADEDRADCRDCLRSPVGRRRSAAQLPPARRARRRCPQRRRRRLQPSRRAPVRPFCAPRGPLGHPSPRQAGGRRPRKDRSRRRAESAARRERRAMERPRVRPASSAEQRKTRPRRRRDRAPKRPKRSTAGASRNGVSAGVSRDDVEGVFVDYFGGKNIARERDHVVAA